MVPATGVAPSSTRNALSPKLAASSASLKYTATVAPALTSPQHLGAKESTPNATALAAITNATGLDRSPLGFTTRISMVAAATTS
jgi:hypothetical protein